MSLELQESSVFFTSRDSTKLHALYFNAEAPKAVLLVIHGMQSHSQWFLSGEFLASKGISVLAFDRRGSGLSEGKRGHVQTHDEFLDDLGDFVKFAREIHPGLPIHVHANCFACRIVIPYIDDNPEVFKSAIFTSPSTHMSDAATYAKLDALRILLSHYSGWHSVLPKSLRGKTNKYIKTPISDDLFTTIDPGISWINNDELSSREVTSSFLIATQKLTRKMQRICKKPLKIPSLYFLFSHDKMVDNNLIKNKFLSIQEKAKVLEIPSEHAIEFSSSENVELYRLSMAKWILSESNSQ